MFCRNCGAEMADNARICMKCGVMAGDGDKFCSNCGAEPDPKAVVCVKCGMVLSPSFNKNYLTPAKVETLMQAVTVCFQKYATFEGRATRAEFWFWQLFHLLCFIGLFLLVFISNFLYNVGNTPVTPDAPQLIEPFWGLPYIYGFYLIFLLGTIMPSLAVVVRRLHDIGKSGWFYFIGAIPIIGGIILLIWMCKDSEPQRNQYGLSLKENRLHKL